MRRALVAQANSVSHPHEYQFILSPSNSATQDATASNSTNQIASRLAPMIVFGTTTLNLKRDRGQFFCPVCRDRKTYVRKAATQFFSIYFIPIFPLGSEGEFIQCDQCRNRFGLDILTFDPDAENPELMIDYVRMMMLIMLTTGNVGRHYLDVVRDAIEIRFGMQVDDDELLEVAQDSERVEAQLIPFASRIGRTHDPETRFDMLKVATQVLSAEGFLSDEHRQLLSELGVAMQIDDDQARELWAAST